MADVAAPTTERIDFLLGYLTRRWEAVPAVAREIDTWDWLDQVSYTEEGGLYRTLLEELRRYAAGQLSPEHRQRYEALERLVARHEPILRAMLR